MTTLPPPTPVDSPFAEPSPLPLTTWLSVLAALTVLATLRTLLLPVWPQAKPLPSPAVLEGVLERHGLRPSAMAGEPAVRNAEQALSPAVVLRLQDGEILRLRRGTMRRWEAFQLAAITRNVPELALKDRRLAAAGPGAPSALGKVKGGIAQQSCLVEGTTSSQSLGVTLEQLTGLVSKRPSSPQAFLAGLLGLRPMRTYDCVVISLQAPGGKEPSTATWLKVVSALTPSLSRASHGSPNL
jgi:hypothetical protein